MSARGDIILGRRALNRALLARQLLARRSAMPVAQALEHLVGLQAQAPMPPYQGLWSRLEAFDPHELGRMLTEREAVRLTLMRGTVHLVTARDALRLRPLLQPAVEQVLGRWLAQARVEAAAVAPAVRALLGAAPLTARELGRRLVEQGLGEDAEAVGHAARVHAALVQVPPRGVWGRGGQARYAPLESWVGDGAAAASSTLDELFVRYLGAFGPASVRDAQNWSGLTRLSTVAERLRPRLVAFRDEDGTELFDLPDAPRPGEDAPAPAVRLLGQFDNVLLGHADRRRIVPEGLPWEPMGVRARFTNSLLLHGMLGGGWWVQDETLTVRLFRAAPKRVRDAIAEEAEGMLAFMRPGAAARAVRFEPA